MRILVIGGQGFLGQSIVKLLNKHHDVSTFSRRPAPLIEAQNEPKHIQGDLTDASSLLKACQGMDAVFHVASKTDLWGPWQPFYAINVQGTQHVIDACLQNNVRHLVYTSTPSVVFGHQSIHNATESLPYPSRWLSPYAHSKALAEQKVLAANSHELRTISLRPHLIWGVGDTHLIPQIIRKASQRKLYVIGQGKNLVDITHVSDAARAHVLALESLVENCKVSGKAYFISHGEPVRLWEWINDLLFKLQLPPAKIKIPYAIAYSLGWMYEQCSKSNLPPMTRFLACQLAKDHYFNINASKRELGYLPQTSTADALNELIESIRFGMSQPAD